MRLSELALIFAIFIIAFYAAKNFAFSFGVQQQLPNEISVAWNDTFKNIKTAQSVVQSGVEKIKSKNPWEQITGLFNLAFGGIFYIIATLWDVLISLPQSIFGAVNYLGNVFGIPSEIIGIITGIISVVVVMKAIEFISGRYL